jgi:hypothetical protein
MYLLVIAVIVALVFAIIAFARSISTSVKGSDIIIDGNTVLSSFVIIDVSTIASPISDVLVGKLNNKTTYNLVNDGIELSAIRFLFSEPELSKLIDGYYLEVVNFSAESHTITTNIDGTVRSVILGVGQSCRIVKNVVTTLSATQTTKKYTGIITNTTANATVSP